LGEELEELLSHVWELEREWRFDDLLALRSALEHPRSRCC
jgi:hypothetical protein